MPPYIMNSIIWFIIFIKKLITFYFMYFIVYNKIRVISTFFSIFKI